MRPALCAVRPVVSTPSAFDIASIGSASVGFALVGSPSIGSASIASALVASALSGSASDGPASDGPAPLALPWSAPRPLVSPWLTPPPSVQLPSAPPTLTPPLMAPPRRLHLLHSAVYFLWRGHCCLTALLSLPWLRQRLPAASAAACWLAGAWQLVPAHQLADV